MLVIRVFRLIKGALIYYVFFIIIIVVTYLRVWFSSKGEMPSEITQRLTSMGFRIMKGNYDYAYDWSRRPSQEDILKLADQVHETLRDTHAIYKLETV